MEPLNSEYLVNIVSSKEEINSFCKKLLKELAEFTKYGDDSYFIKFSAEGDAFKGRTLRILYGSRIDEDAYHEAIYISFETLTDKDKLETFFDGYRKNDYYAARAKKNLKMRLRKTMCPDGRAYVKNELKFRAKSIEFDDWVYGIPMKAKDNKYYMLKSNIGLNFDRYVVTAKSEKIVWIDPDTICGVTALKAVKNLSKTNKNVLDVYIGDVIKVKWLENAWAGKKSTMTAVVERFAGVDKIIAFKRGKDILNDFYVWPDFANMDFGDGYPIIIGNRIDNPELVDEIKDVYSNIKERK